MKIVLRERNGVILKICEVDENSEEVVNEATDESYDVITESDDVVIEDYYVKEVGVVSISENLDKSSCRINVATVS